MYQVNVRVRGTTPILQHAFTGATLENLMGKKEKVAGTRDYSCEWMDTMYATADGFIYQPANHLEGAMIRSAVKFPVAGKKGKSHKDNFKGYVYVKPLEILHLWNGEPISAPTADLLTNPTEHLCINIARVVVNRAAVARARLQLSEAWELAFTIEVVENGIKPDLLYDVLADAGRSVGIGDWRPRYGRFTVTTFEQVPA